MLKSYGYMSISTDDLSMYYCADTDKWYPDGKYPANISGSYWMCSDKTVHSVKAAKRHLRKHNEIPKGTVFVLQSKYRGFPNVMLTKK